MSQSDLTGTRNPVGGATGVQNVSNIARNYTSPSLQKMASHSPHAAIRVRSSLLGKVNNIIEQLASISFFLKTSTMRNPSGVIN